MDIDYHALLPEIILAATIVGVLILDMLPVEKYWTAALGLMGLVASAVPLLTLGVLEDVGVREMFGGSYVVDRLHLGPGRLRRPPGQILARRFPLADRFCLP